ncbi:hypothetical protein PTTG_26697 [Puccinia triticina 1-1 BBBD Race 1]|uniref:Uncharacterized protein n=1 Tax=Puccinia triticina (isolate 1-1 / race 1 (BBBD)) TaxID=630390 RepID=A0A180GSI9_PUCT1|nr:hypothetical protein PTTG_26697 [Puccinia triticina 1-1 BBBD Race 1]
MSLRLAITYQMPQLLITWSRRTLSRYNRGTASTSLKENLRRLSVSSVTVSSPRRTCLQPASMTPIHSYASLRTASNVALLTPMVRAHNHGGPATVNAALQAIFHNLITTPSELNTLVYTQSDNK